MTLLSVHFRSRSHIHEIQWAIYRLKIISPDTEEGGRLRGAGGVHFSLSQNQGKECCLNPPQLLSRYTRHPVQLQQLKKQFFSWSYRQSLNSQLNMIKTFWNLKFRDLVYINPYWPCHFSSPQDQPNSKTLHSSEVYHKVYWRVEGITKFTERPRVPKHERYRKYTCFWLKYWHICDGMQHC